MNSSILPQATATAHQAVLDLLHSKFFKGGDSSSKDQVVIYALDSIAGDLDQINILMSEA